MDSSEENDQISYEVAGNATKKDDEKKSGVPKLALQKIKVGILDSYKSRSARPTFYN